MRSLLVLLIGLYCSLASAAGPEYPKKPDAQLTPGSLCKKASTYRYTERIAYCERDVSSDEKNDIFDAYRALGYRLDVRGKRSDYKIDHYIPLCAGGSNSSDNLWPQHISVYTITDPLETIGCEKLKNSRISQKDLINLIKKGKNDLSEVDHIISYLEGL